MVSGIAWRARLQSLREHAGFRRYFANTAWLVVERILRLVASLFVGVLVARYLGPAQFGQISYAQSLVLLFAVLANLGLDGPLTRELVMAEARRDLLLGTAWCLKMAGAVLLVAGLLLALPFSGHSMQDNQLITVIALCAVFQTTSVFESFFAAVVRSRRIVVAQLAQLMLSSVVKVLLVVFEAPLLYFGIAILADAVLLAGFYVLAGLKDGLSVLRWRFSFEAARQLLHDAWPLMLAITASALYTRIDQVMLKSMLGDSAVGLYAAAVRISEAWNFIPMAICGSVFPAVLAARGRSGAEYENRMQSLYDLMAILGFVVAIPVAVFAEELVALLFGESFSQAAPMLVLHVIGAPFLFMGVAMHQWLLAEQFTIKVMIRAGTGALVNVLMNFWLIPIWGGVGAAFATLTSHFATNFAYDCFDSRARNQLRLKLKALVLPYAIMRVATMLTRHNRREIDGHGPLG